MEIYSTRDGTGRHLSVHKDQVGPGMNAYFIDVTTRSGRQWWVLNATSALNLGRALLCSVHDDDALEPAPEVPPPTPPTLHVVD